MRYLRQKVQGGTYYARYRHPVIGKVVEVSAETDSEIDAAQISAHLFAILSDRSLHHLSHLNDAIERFHPLAVKSFYKPLTTQAYPFKLTVEVPAGGDVAHGIRESVALAKLTSDYCDRAVRERSLEAEAASLRKQLQDALGAPHNMAKLTVAQAIQKFQDGERFKNPKTKTEYLRRIRSSLALLADRPLLSLSLADTEAVLTSTKKAGGGEASECERNARRSAVRRFLRWCESDLDFHAIRKVWTKIHVTSPHTLAYSRDVETLSLDTIKGILAIKGAHKFPSEEQREYFACAIGLLAYTGLRLAELLALKWEDVDWQDQLLRVHPSEAKGELKTVKSARFVPPLLEAWPVFRRLQTLTCKPELTQGFILPRMLDRKLVDRCWLAKKYATDTSMASHLFVLKARKPWAWFGLPKDASRQARRTAETEFRKRGWHEDDMALVMGHTGVVGRAHYTQQREVVLARARVLHRPCEDACEDDRTATG